MKSNMFVFVVKNTTFGSWSN